MLTIINFSPTYYIYLSKCSDLHVSVYNRPSMYFVTIKTNVKLKTYMAYLWLKSNYYCDHHQLDSLCVYAYTHILWYTVGGASPPHMLKYDQLPWVLFKSIYASGWTYMLLFVSCVFDCDTIPDTPDKLRALDVLCTSSFACRALNAHSCLDKNTHFTGILECVTVLLQ